MRHMAPGFTERKLRFAAALRTARTRAGMSQERAATAVGTSRRHWIRWETGETSPNPAYLERIADVLNAPELLESEEDEEVSSMQPLSHDEYAMYGALTARIVATGATAFDKQLVKS